MFRPTQTRNITAEERERRRKFAKEKLPKFPKGVCPNPGGRPKRRLIDDCIIDLLSDDDGKIAEQVARAVIRTARQGSYKAAALLAERSQGRPTTKVELSGPAGGAIPLTISFLDAIIGTEEE